jgi:basic membrane protein A
MFDRGADVIFHASGTTGFGVFESARERGKLAIGVDSDQWDEAPGTVLTSMVKDVDVAVFSVIREVRERRFQGGVRELGLRDDGVRIVRDERNRSLLPDPVWTRIEALADSVAAGWITVPRQ